MRPHPYPMVVALLLACAPRPAPETTTGETRWDPVVESVIETLRASYVFPETAEYSAEMLRRKLARGGYRDGDPDAFARSLTSDLRALTGDGQLEIRFAPEERAPAAPDDEPTPEQRAEARRRAERDGFGLGDVEVLPGNVGLLELRTFPSRDGAAAALDAAMEVLGKTGALIVDVRESRGGDPETVAHLATYFFGEERRVHLDDAYHRARNPTRALWTEASVPGDRYTDRPVFVVPSGRTAAAAEALGYDLQAQGRALIVGETTVGMANRGGPVGVGAGFVAFVPTAEVTSPVTRASWDHTGVKPDVAAPAASAVAVAHTAALRAMLRHECDPG